MTDSRTGGWWCPWCRKDIKAAHSNCGFCGVHWSECVSAPKSPRRRRQTPGRRTSWNYDGEWTEGNGEPWTASTPRRQQSPRQRSTKSPARQQPKAKKAAKKTAAPAPEPAWNPGTTTVAASASSAPSAAALSQAAQDLRDLVGVLKKSDLELTPEIQAAMSKVKVVTPKEASKLMHGAVSRLDAARDKLQKAREARSNMHRNWSKFIADAVKRWQEHSERFTAEDKNLLEAVEAATTSFQEARTHLEETKESLAEFDNLIEEVHEVSDEELMTDSVPGIAGGIQEMLSSLRRLQDSQEELETSAAKRPRIEKNKEGVKDGKPATLPSMQPFGGGDKQT